MQAGSLVLLILITMTSVGSQTARDGPGHEVAPDWLDGLVKQLGDRKFVTREAATRELIAIGEPALPSLRKAAAAPDAEVRSRAERASEGISRHITARELKRLQGTWSLVSYEMNGRRIKGEDKAHVFVFKGDEWSLQIAGSVFQAGTVQRIEVQGKLNAIDLMFTQGGNVGTTAVSIYAVESNSLRYVNSGEPRATEFATKPGDGRHYLTFRRAGEPWK